MTAKFSGSGRPPQRWIVPLAGIWTAVMAIALTVVAIFAATLARSSEETPSWTVSEDSVKVFNKATSRSSWDDKRFRMIVAGLDYGALASLVWWSSHLRRKWVRWSLVAAFALFLAWGLSSEGQRAMTRYLSLMSGLAIIQSLLFWIAGVPAWSTLTASRSAFMDAPQVTHRKRGRFGSGQFGMADLIALTAAVAVLIASAKGYQASFDDPTVTENLGFLMQEDSILAGQMNSATIVYWMGAGVIWCWLPVLSLILAKAATSPAWWKAGSFWVVVLGWGILGVSIITELQVMISKSGAEMVGTLWGDYGVFTVLYASFFGAIAFAGRCDASVRCREN